MTAMAAAPAKNCQLSYILSDDIQYLTSRWVNENGHYSGIAGQTVINALFFSVLLGWFFSKLLIEKKYVFTIGVISILIILIILTGKKGSVGGNLLALFLVLCIYQKISKKSMKYLYILLLLGIGSLLGGAMLLDIERINLIMGSSVISRNRIYIEIWPLFWKNPILGNGTDSVAFFVGHSAHNSYIQILCEYGIVGTFIFALVIIYISVDIMKRSRICLKSSLVASKEKSAILASIYYQIYFFSTGLFESTFLNYRMLFLYFIAIASIYAIDGKYKNGQDKCERSTYGI